MRRSTPPTLVAASVLAATLLASAAAAQTPTVLDDFNGATINPRTWAVQSPSMTSQSNSRLKFDVTATAFEETYAGLVPWDGFRGHFDLILDFDGFTPNMVRGQAGLEIYVSDLDDPDVNDHGVSIEISATATSRQFITYEDTSSGLRRVVRATSASAGQLRVFRDAQGIHGAFREAGQSNWTILQTWPNVLTDAVQVNLNAWCGEDPSTNNSGTLKVSCDKLSYGGQRVPGPFNYGVGCQDLIAYRYGLAYTGNSTFGIALFGDSKFGNAPLTLILGLSSTAIPLAPAGAPGCFLNTDLILLLPGGTTDPWGYGVTKLPVPNNAALVGIQINAQMAVRTNTNAFGFATSNGVAIEIVKL